jgi:cysteine desulfurase
MLARTAIFLDANAGGPLKPAALEAILFVLNIGDRGFNSPLLPNPSSIHSHGRQAKRLVADAREKVARTLGPGIDPEQLVFTSSGTEANQLAIRGILEPLLDRGERPHWITTKIEHDSGLQLVEWLERRGGLVSFLPVDEQGRIDTSKDKLDELWRPETALVSMVWVNNETGVIADAEALARAVRARRGILHLDAAQAWGKLPVNLMTLGADLVTFSGHKIGALAGIGLLWVGPGRAPSALLRGKQEKGRRGGTENLLGIISLGAASDTLEPDAWGARVAPLRDRLENVIRSRIPGTQVNGLDAPRVANTLNLSFENIEGDGLVMALDLAGYSVSSGSACSSGVLEPSHVLLAMGRPRAQAMSAVRISLVDEMPWDGPAGLGLFVDALEKAVSRARLAVENRK